MICATDPPAPITGAKRGIYLAHNQSQGPNGAHTGAHARGGVQEPITGAKQGIYLRDGVDKLHGLLLQHLRHLLKLPNAAERENRQHLVPAREIQFVGQAHQPRERERHIPGNQLTN
eukprot:1059177-Prorocentrum_minimum.AAC.1